MRQQAFFHSASRYNKLRQTFTQVGKLIGFLSSQSLELPGEAGGHAEEEEISGDQDALGDKQSTALKLATFAIHADGVSALAAPECRFQLKSTEDVSVAEFNLDGLGYPELTCRALLIHPDVLRHLRRVDARLTLLSDEQVLERILHDRFLDARNGIEEILASVPDWDATISEQGSVAFDRYALSDKVGALETAAFMLIVVDARSVAIEYTDTSIMVARSDDVGAAVRQYQPNLEMAADPNSTEVITRRTMSGIEYQITKHTQPGLHTLTFPEDLIDRSFKLRIEGVEVVPVEPINFLGDVVVRTDDIRQLFYFRTTLEIVMQEN